MVHGSGRNGLSFARATLTDSPQIRALANSLSRYPKIGLDTESSGPDLIHLKGKKTALNVYRSTLTGLSIALPGDWPESYYVPVGHKRGNASLGDVAALFRALEDYTGVTCIHNVKHERRVLGTTAPIGFSALRRPHCTQVLAWLLQVGAKEDDEAFGGYGLKALAWKHLMLRMTTFADVTHGLDFSQFDPHQPEIRDYACGDAEAALGLHDLLHPLLLDYPGLEAEYEEVEMPFVAVLDDMERAGMYVDPGILGDVLVEFQARIAQVEEEWHALLPDVSISSSVQLQQLYEQGHWSSLGIPRGKSGALSTEGEYIESQLFRLRAKTDSLGYRAADLKIRFGHLDKLVSTYGYKLLQKAQQYPDQRLHCEYMHTGTATGRLSSSYPNLQNIPVRTEDGKLIRTAFLPAPGWRYLSADYSQIELRVLAHFAGRGELFEGYRKGVDVHRLTASDLFGVPFDKVTPKQRDDGKTTNFSTIYGVGPAKLGRKIGMGKEAAKSFVERYKEGRPEIGETLKRAVRAAESRGYVKTLLGRIRRLRVAEARAEYRRLHAEGHSWDNSEEYRQAWLNLGREERKAGNTPIQGSARDIITLGMIAFHGQMDQSRCKMVAQIHDDLICEMRDDYLEEGTALLQECLESAYKLRVPLVAEPKAGDSWAELK